MAKNVGKKQTSRLVVASLAAGALTTVTRPAILSKVYAANQYEWVRQEGTDRLGGEYTSAAVSADGNHLILGTVWGGEGTENVSPLLISSNYGASWQNVAPDIDSNIRYFWQSVDVSNDGQTMVAAADGGIGVDDHNGKEGMLFLSSNNGDSWADISPDGVSSITDVVVSGDGEKIVALEPNDDLLYISTNGGDDWSTTTLPDVWNLKSIAVSDNGGKILVGGESDNDDTELFITENDGNNWTNISPSAVGDDQIYTVVPDISADGNKIVSSFIGYNGSANDAVYVSDDAGDTWEDVTPDNENENTWLDTTISDDGSTIATIDEYGSVFTSGDFGANWSTEDPTEGSEDDSAWRAIDLNSDGTMPVAASMNEAYLVASAPTSDSSVSLVDAEGGKAIQVTTPDGTTITCYSGVKESEQEGQDASYQYPLGLVDFCFDTENEQNEVTLTFVTELTPDDVVARKYNPETKEYSDVPGVTVTETTFEGEHALQITYTIEDNGPLDLDPDDGEIADPVGLAVAPSDLANTGTPASTYVIAGLAIVITSAAGVAISRKQD